MIQRLLPFVTLHRSVRWTGDRVPALSYEHESVERRPSDRRDQHHGAGHDADHRLGRHRSVRRRDPRHGRPARHHGDGKGAARFQRASLIGILTGCFWGFVNGLLTTQAQNQPVHRDAGHAGHRARSDADHLQRTSGSPDPAGVLVSGRRQRAGRAVRAVDPAGVRADRARRSWSTRSSAAMRSRSAAIRMRRSMRVSR